MSYCHVGHQKLHWKKAHKAKCVGATAAAAVTADAPSARAGALPNGLPAFSEDGTLNLSGCNACGKFLATRREMRVCACLAAVHCLQCIKKGKEHGHAACYEAAATRAAYLQSAAERGSGMAAIHLAGCYEVGAGVRRSRSQALKWAQVAATLGNSEGQSWMGLAYMRGDELPMDSVRALALLEAAAAQGHVNAMASVGFLLSRGGAGVPVDPERAFEFSLRAAEQGDGGAMVNVFCAYNNGDGVAQDLKQAAEWRRRAKQIGWSTGGGPK